MFLAATDQRWETVGLGAEGEEPSRGRSYPTCWRAGLADDGSQPVEAIAETLARKLLHGDDEGSALVRRRRVLVAEAPRAL